MYSRLDDIVVGVISGAVCSVLAAVIEGVIAAVRLFSFGRIGTFGGELLTVALIGALLGGLVSVFLGARAKTSEVSR